MNTKANSTPRTSGGKSSLVNQLPVSERSSSSAYNNGDEKDISKADGSSSVEMQEATEFITDFDAALFQLEQLERGKERGVSKLSMVSQEEHQLEFEEFLVKARLSKKQKQALLLMILCFDAEIPASVFEKLCKSHTMKAICDEVFNNKSIGILTEIA